MISRTSRYAIVEGFRVAFRSYRGNQVLLSTDDAEIAAKLGFSLSGYGDFSKWVPRVQVSEFIQETWFGELDGQIAWIRGEDGDHYQIQVRNRTIASLWSLREVERGEWEGLAPKGAFARVWSKVQPFEP